MDDLPVECARGFDPSAQGNDTVFLVRQGKQVFAYKDVCPHYGDTTLPWKKDAYLDAGQDFIVCAAHGALFEIESGMCVSGPCRGEALQSLPLHIDENGDIWLQAGATEENV